ncbi:IS630 family transposase [Candidatus Accumulibacter phosphatis]|uniref:Mobile element protein n=1 Tax=Candidatus Accumulibacter phosphatis TaxID=327160 RepID=A0A5S4F685_9PROT|nr:IS630 family transposase [Candidatus Accumulibacter phosphatis]TMQ76253.1 Mobile element protein [Candidatus Accumulibacter phosphatis]
MGRKTMRGALVLTEEQRAMLTKLAGSRTVPVREVERSKVLLGYASGASISEVMRREGVGRPLIYRYIDKALAKGVEAGLKDAGHRPRAPEITDEAKAWVVNVACTQPKDHGLAAELWTLRALAGFISEHAEAAGYPRLSPASKSTVWRILNEQHLKPHKIRYDLERRDPEFERKREEVLRVHRDVSIDKAEAVHDGRPRAIYTVGIDEKPGVQALGVTAPDLPPVPKKEPTVSRDYEYVRHGTVSILAGIDLHSGHLFGHVEDRHRSIEFIGLLQEMDAYYPPEATIRLVLDHHSAHILKETNAFIATRPDRFEYVHTPKHGSWLNLIECVFSKMARTFLRHIRVKSVEELKTRLLKGIKEMNEALVVVRWKKFDMGIV